jgi:predicted Zn-dependent peptidase
MTVQRHTLANGIRLVHLPSERPVAHCGIFIPAGTRHEKRNEHGIAHFIEHTLFKGTEKRNMIQVLNRLENVGADLNAFTTKEETIIHASFLSVHYERTLELIHDICFHSTFPEKEIEKEKQVVIDEIRSYQDSPFDQVYDDFEDLLFDGHPLGRNILGSTRSVKTFKRDDLFDFVERNYRSDKTVFCSVGDIDFSRLVKLADRYFGKEETRTCKERSGHPAGHIPTTRFVKKPVNQVHCVLGAMAYPFADRRRIPLALLNNLLGGPAMNSRLSLALREKKGISYHVDSSYTPYSDTGILAIYFGTDPALYDKAFSVISHELKRLREEELNRSQLKIACDQLKGQMAIAHESNLSVMFTIGRSILRQDRYDPLDVMMAKIDRITAYEIREIACEILDPGRFSILAFTPKT